MVVGSSECTINSNKKALLETNNHNKIYLYKKIIIFYAKIKCHSKQYCLYKFSTPKI